MKNLKNKLLASGFVLTLGLFGVNLAKASSYDMKPVDSIKKIEITHETISNIYSQSENVYIKKILSDGTEIRYSDFGNDGIIGIKEVIRTENDKTIYEFDVFNDGIIEYREIEQKFEDRTEKILEAYNTRGDFKGRAKILITELDDGTLKEEGGYIGGRNSYVKLIKPNGDIITKHDFESDGVVDYVVEEITILEGVKMTVKYLLNPNGLVDLNSRKFDYVYEKKLQGKVIKEFDSDGNCIIDRIVTETGINSGVKIEKDLNADGSVDQTITRKTIELDF